MPVIAKALLPLAIVAFMLTQSFLKRVQGPIQD